MWSITFAFFAETNIGLIAFELFRRVVDSFSFCSRYKSVLEKSQTMLMFDSSFMLLLRCAPSVTPDAIVGKHRFNMIYRPYRTKMLIRMSPEIDSPSAPHGATGFVAWAKSHLRPSASPHSIIPGSMFSSESSPAPQCPPVSLKFSWDKRPLLILLQSKEAHSSMHEREFGCVSFLTAYWNKSC